MLGLLLAPMLVVAGHGSRAGSVDVEPDFATAAAPLVGANSSLCVAVPGASPGDVAVVNITNTQQTNRGYGALRASGTTPVYQRPASSQFSSVNFAPGPPNPNLAFAKIGADNKICYDGAVTSHNVILDLAATIPAPNIDAIDPTRILDTRTTSPVGANSSLCVAVPGASPGDVAVVNITNTQQTNRGYGALRASGTTPVYQRPASSQFSSVNFFCAPVATTSYRSDMIWLLRCRSVLAADVGVRSTGACLLRHSVMTVMTPDNYCRRVESDAG